MDEAKNNILKDNTNDANEKKINEILSPFQEDIENNYEDNTFTIVNDNNEEVKCEILFTYCDENTGKNYIVYTDNTLDEDGSTKVFASIFNPEDENPILLPIETEEEWEMIERILEGFENGDYIDVEPDSVTKNILDWLNEE